MRTQWVCTISELIDRSSGPEHVHGSTSSDTVSPSPYDCQPSAEHIMSP